MGPDMATPGIPLFLIALLTYPMELIAWGIVIVALASAWWAILK
jgi:hypothetical protein